MSLASPFSTYERRFIAFTIILGVFAMFFQLGLYPMFMEEPRRALIALEMDLRGNFWVPTQMGDLYFKKPPLFNWVYIIFAKLFGEYSEIVLRSISVISHILFSWVVFYFFKKRTQVEVAILTALSFFASVDILYYYSTLGEIDLFYALLTTSSFFLIFIFDERKRYWELFLSVYALTALCFLTKGLSALPYTALTLLVYFLISKRFKLLFSIQHFASIGLFLFLLSMYFYGYSQYADVTGWFDTLLSESTEKASGSGFSKWFMHFLTFPVDTIKDVIPAALLLPAVFLNRKESKVDKIWIWIIIANFAVYWLSAEGRSRYIYPLFPLICYYLIEKSASFDKEWFQKCLIIFGHVILGIMVLAIPILPFVESLRFLTHQWLFVIISELLLGLIWMSYIKYKIRPYLIIIAVMFVARFGMSYIVPQTRVNRSDAMADKKSGLKIAEITRNKPVYRWGDLRLSTTVVFYLTREKEQILYQKNEIIDDAYYLVSEDDLNELPESEVLHEILYQEMNIYLVKPNGSIN